MADNNENAKSSRPRSTSFFSALLQRSTSFRGDDEIAVGDGDMRTSRPFFRSRSMSESSVHEREAYSPEEGNIVPNEKQEVASSQRKMSWTQALLGGPDRLGNSYLHNTLVAEDEENQDEEQNKANETLEEVSPIAKPENLTQTDHLNKRLLSSFLEKLNLSDLGKTSENGGNDSAPFSDDFLIDRICKRLENERK